MWIRVFALTLVLAGSFALAACGGGNNSSDKSDDKCCGGDETPKTPEAKREVLANRMKAAAEAHDIDKVKELFAEEEHAMIDKHMAPDFKKYKESGVKVTIKVKEIKEEDGKYVAYFESTVVEDGTPYVEEKKLAMIEKDGEWLLSFKR